MDALSQYLSILNLILLICSAVGGYVAVKHSRKAAIIAVQKETIEALQEQINALKDKVEELEQKNTQQTYIITTIQEALLKRGIIVTVDGDLVTIQDAGGSHSMRHRTTTQPLQGSVQPARTRKPAAKKEQP